MFIKLEQRNKETGKLLEVQCDHYVWKKLWADGKGSDKVQIGIELSLSTGHIIQLPRDGAVIYVENDKGDTIDTVRWPPKKQNGDIDKNAKVEFRV